MATLQKEEFSNITLSVQLNKKDHNLHLTAAHSTKEKHCLQQMEHFVQCICESCKEQGLSLEKSSTTVISTG